jgi:hypothetical protein
MSGQSHKYVNYSDRNVAEQYPVVASALAMCAPDLGTIGILEAMREHDKVFKGGSSSRFKSATRWLESLAPHERTQAILFKRDVADRWKSRGEVAYDTIVDFALGER